MNLTYLNNYLQYERLGSSYMDYLNQVWMKMICWFLRRVSLAINSFPLDKDVALYLNNFQFPQPDNDLCQLELKSA
jgi:hypothetical protein